MVAWPLVALIALAAFCLGGCVGLLDAITMLRRERRRITVELGFDSPEARRALAGTVGKELWEQAQRETTPSNVVRLR